MSGLTNNYSLVLPVVGGDNNTWGTELNSGMIDGVDNALAGIQAVAITSADVTITSAQFQNAIFNVTGTLTGNRSLIIPLSPNSGSVACAGRFVVVNNTAGAFNLTVKTVAGGSVGVVVPQGFTAFLYSDGINVGFCSNGLAGFAAAVNGNPNGQLAGTAGSVNTNASLAYDYGTGTGIWLCTTTGNAAGAVWTQPALTVKRGFDTAINMGLAATHDVSNNLNISVLTGDTNATPTSSDPVTIIFPNSGGGSGAPVVVNITAALTVQILSGATLGSIAATPFRFWIVAFYNGGTPVLGVINCSVFNGIISSSVFALPEYGAVSSTVMSAGSTSAGVFYTPGGTVTNNVFRILGFVEYGVGGTLATPGVYTSDPTWIRLFGPGVKKPGDVVQATYFSTSTGGSGQVTASITPTSSANLIRVDAQQNMQGSSGVSVSGQIRRGGATLIGRVVAVGSGGGSITTVGVGYLAAFDAPGAISSQSYTIIITAGSGVFQGGVINLQEIMG